MARKHKHEDHVNHEAWAIPYGDLITLLLAFFVVMYSVSSLNEGKYRTMSASFAAAFRGIPTTTSPVQIGEAPAMTVGSPVPVDLLQTSTPPPPPDTTLSEDIAHNKNSLAEMEVIAQEIEKAMGQLISDNLVLVRSSPYSVEIEIQTDILYPSGIATLTDKAVAIMERLAQIMKTFSNPIRVEGHTDSVPISTSIFPSNWELSAARAAGVVQLFTLQGIEPSRMSVVGYGEFKPAASNDTVEGRNRNRRVLLTIPSRSALKLMDQLGEQGTTASSQNRVEFEEKEE